MQKPLQLFLIFKGIHAASVAGTFDEIPAASVLPEFVAGDLSKPAPAVEASVLPEIVAGDLTKPAAAIESACGSDDIQEEVIEVPELEIELPAVPEIIENPCADVEVEEEAAPVVPEVEVIIPEAPVVRPLPEEEETAVAPEIEVIVPEVGACAEESEVVVEAPVASILPAPAVVDASQLISAQPIKLD